MLKNYNNKKLIENDERIKRDKDSKGKWITYFEERQMKEIIKDIINKEYSELLNYDKDKLLSLINDFSPYLLKSYNIKIDDTIVDMEIKLSKYYSVISWRCFNEIVSSFNDSLGLSLEQKYILAILFNTKMILKEFSNEYYDVTGNYLTIDNYSKDDIVIQGLCRKYSILSGIILESIFVEEVSLSDDELPF